MIHPRLHTQYPDKVYHEALYRFRLHELFPLNQDFALPGIAKELRVPYSTIYDWYTQRESMSDEDRQNRHLLDHPPTLLTDYEELLIAGRICHRNLHRKVTSTQDTIDWVLRTWNVKISKPFLSKFLARHHLSIRLPSNSNVTEIDTENSIARGIAFINYVRSLGLKSKQLVSLDKCNFHTRTEHTLQIAPKGRSTHTMIIDCFRCLIK